MFRAALLAGGLLLTIAGCQADLGECNLAVANRIAIADTGYAYYEGQAIINRDCASGSCHSEDIRPSARKGVPEGFDFGLETACIVGSDGSCTSDASSAFASLREHAGRVFDLRRTVMGEVEAGTMPPAGENPIGTYYKFGASSTFDLTTRTGDTLLPSIDSAEGQEILRNWLACGAPVIGANAYAADIADVGTSCAGRVEVGECVVSAVVEPPEPNWDSIYDFFSGGNCVTGCHTLDDGDPETPIPTDPEDFPENYALSRLDLSSAEVAYAELLGESDPASDACTGTLVVPGSPDESLLIQKLEGGVRNADEELVAEDLCGDPMPASGVWTREYIDPIREWIANGAPEM